MATVIGHSIATNTSWSNATRITATGLLKLEGNGADIDINGQKLSDWMEMVNKRLSILQPKPELLEKHECLKQAYEHYKTLETLLYEQD